MNHLFDIADYGARPNGQTVNTDAIQRAIGACHEAGGGQVVCGPGTWLTGGLELRSNVELHLAPGCRLVGSPDLAHYGPLVAEGFDGEHAPEKSTHSLIGAADAENVAVTGAGTINGSGLAFYENVEDTTGKLEKPPTPRPRMIMFYRCRNVRIMDVEFVDSPCWTIWLMQCEGVRVQGISASGNRRMRNVDGIDIDACRDVTVSDCRFDTEDDCVVLRAITQLYDAPAVCENVTVTNCVLKTACQGVRVGCTGDGIIRNCTFSELVIESTNNGILFENPHRYLPRGCDPTADVTNILFSNVAITCRNTPIRVNVEAGLALPRLARLTFSNMRIRSGGPCVIHGSPETIIRDVQLNNIQLDTTGEDAIVCRYCEGVRLNNVQVGNQASES